MVRTAAVMVALTATPLPAGALAIAPSALAGALVLERPPGTTSPFIARFVADHPEVHVIQAMAADLNRDGDLDVLASTVEAPLVVWINDGSGHFTGPAAGTAWRFKAGRGSRVHTPRRAQPSVVTQPRYGDIFSGGAYLVLSVPTRAAVDSMTASLPTLGLFTSGPSRAPPTTHTA